MSWVGGNIATIENVAHATQGYAKAVVASVEPLGASLKRIASDAGWTGDAAEAFEAHWRVTTVAAVGVGEFSAAVGSALATLAAQLRKLDSALHQYADEMRKLGAVVSPEGLPVAATYTNKQALDAAQRYAAFWRETQLTAAGFRLQANQALLAAAGRLAEAPSGPSDLSNPDKVAFGDFLRGFPAADAAQHRSLHDELQKARDAYHEARLKYQDALKGHNADAAMLRSSHSKSISTLVQAEHNLNALTHRKEPLGHLLDLRVGDVVRGVGGALLGDAAKFSSAVDASKVLRFAAELPVIDVAAGAASTGFQSIDDIQKGENPIRAVAQNAAANAGGLVAGTLAGSAVAGAVLSAPVSVPGLAVGSSIAVGGVTAIGVGNVLYEGFHEHWGADIQKHGVVGGVAHGVQNSVGRGLDSTRNLANWLWDKVPKF